MYDLSHTEVDVTYDPTGGDVASGDEGELLYTPNSDFRGSEVLEYSVCTVATPVRCDKSTITISVVEDDQISNSTIVEKGSNDLKDGATASISLGEAAAIEDKPKSGSIIAGAFGAFGVLLCIAGATIRNKRHEEAAADRYAGKTNDSYDTEGTSLTGNHQDNMRPPMSMLKIPYGGNSNNLSITAFLTGEHTQNPESSRSGTSPSSIFREDKSVVFPLSPTNFLFSPTHSVKTSPATSLKSVRSSFVADTVDL
jgi:hypothetical protein